MDIHEWCNKTRACDIMTRKVESVWPTHTLAQVAAVVLREGVSGVPVVSQDGVCVGVFSISDFLKAEEKVAEKQVEAASSGYFTSDLVLPSRVYDEQLEKIRKEIALAAERPVSEFMSTDLIYADLDAPLSKILASVIDSRIHRLLVLDEERHLKGLVSTIDILMALKQASQRRS